MLKLIVFVSFLSFTIFQLSWGCGSSVKQKIKICQDGIVPLKPEGPGVKIQSPKSRLYSHIDCDWKILIDKNCHKPIFKCDQFRMEFSIKCNENYLELIDNEVKVRYVCIVVLSGNIAMTKSCRKFWHFRVRLPE